LCDIGAPIRHITTPQTEHTPLMIGMPFSKVFVRALFTNLRVLHLKQKMEYTIPGPPGFSLIANICLILSDFGKYIHVLQLVNYTERITYYSSYGNRKF
jgi:hypothetical protein